MPKKSTTLTKAQRLAKDVADAVGAGKILQLESVDFSDPNRPKTCLEVDFPILPINHVAAIEGNAGKPIYQMSKWWARRRSSVFRSMLLAAAAKAPDDPAEAAKLVWDSYYGNHQKNKAFRKLKVADIFMGGGTTVVEGSRLGMEMYGNDLNPVAWFIVKNEMAQVDPEAVQKLLDEIEAKVKPQIMPFYACDCPRGHKGKWRHKKTSKEVDKNFDPLALTPKERAEYEYKGPEVIYTFWAKHGPCQKTGCYHRTPIMTTPVVAVKELSVKTWKDVKCPKCHAIIDVEEKPARMAPTAEFYDEDYDSYATLRDDFSFICPCCLKTVASGLDAGEVSYTGRKTVNKKVELTLLVHPDWLKGAPGKDKHGKPFGGSATDDAESTATWNRERAKTLKLIEVRGKLPEKITLHGSKEEFYTDHRGGTVPRQSTFECHAATCGTPQDVLESIKETGKTGPVAMYAIQGYCPQCDAEKKLYGGRFFDLPDIDAFNAAAKEWEQRKNGDLKEFWPKEKIQVGMEIGPHDVYGHHYSHWWTLFNNRQLLILSSLLKSLQVSQQEGDLLTYVLGAFQQYIRNYNMFCIWDKEYDKLVPMMSNNNFRPSATVIEGSVFSDLGRGNWKSSSDCIFESAQWQAAPWERVVVSELAKINPVTAKGFKTKSTTTFPSDPVLDRYELTCGSSSELSSIKKNTFDMVITDPPFGDLMQYSELADFFYVWLRLALKDRYPNEFGLEYTPKALEAVSNKARHPDDPDGFYQDILTECWREAWRIMKPGGILAFTFHHSQDEPWLNVLRSLFEAGFYLEATFPIRSDETKGDNAEFGSQKIEFDIIHVCRKRLEEPKPISWARLRKQIIDDIAQIKTLLAHHAASGLQEADLQVIRRGKALEYFSKHYGKVFIAEEGDFNLRSAILGINQILDDQRDQSKDVPPVAADPYTRTFLRLFIDTDNLARDQVQKHLRGTGIAPSEFVERNWCREAKKLFTLVPPLEFASGWKGKHRSGIGNSIGRAGGGDLDQALFLIGACHEGSGINVKETLSNRNFNAHPALADVLEWFTKHGCNPTVKSAARLALQLFKGSVAEKSIKPDVQPHFAFEES